MPVGTSLGQLFDDDFHYFQNQHDPDKFPSTGELKPPETPDNNVLTPKGLEGNKNQATDPDLEIPITQRLDVYRTNPPEMPPGAPTEVTGAFKSPEATQVAPSTNASPGASYALPDFTNDRPHDWVERTAIAAGKAFQLPGDVLSGKVQAGSIQEIERATDLAGLMVAGPAPIASKMADGTLGSFAGVTSKTLDKTKLYQANEMELNKHSADAIWQETGFFKGADNRWKYEIPDEAAKINDKGFNKTELESNPSAGGEKDTLYSVKPPKKDFFGKTYDHTLLPDVLDHPELYKAYPELKNVKVVPIEAGRDATGSVNFADNAIKLKDELHPSYVRSVILHEVQHLIQNKEGFAGGGNRAQFLGENKDWDIATEKYKRLMGEVESRNVQSRMDFNEARRWFNSPRSTEDRPRFVQTDLSQKK